MAASGWAIAEAARADAPAWRPNWPRQHNCPAEQLTAKWWPKRPRPATRRRRAIFRRATQTYGWAIAQMITLLSPEVVVVGGGVPLAGEALFFSPLRQEVDRYVFPPLAGNVSHRPRRTGRRGRRPRGAGPGPSLAENGNTTGLFVP